MLYRAFSSGSCRIAARTKPIAVGVESSHDSSASALAPTNHAALFLFEAPHQLADDLVYSEPPEALRGGTVDSWRRTVEERHNVAA